MENDDFDLPKAPLSLSCPTCGENLIADPSEATELICIAEHHFNLASLLIQQSLRAASLLEAGKRLLQEQVDLVSALTSQLWLKRPDDAARLDHQMDLLREKIELINSVIDVPGDDEDDGL